ncbi:MAG: hypothetical protein ACJ74H_12370 [Thermoanaerobaculia bacterium]
MDVVENPSKRTFQWPADYYSSPTPKPVLPQWAPFGCGAAAVVVLILVCAGAALLSSGRFLDFMDFAIGMSISEMQGQYAKDVSAEQKKSLDAEIERMRKNLREQKISVQAMQPFLQRMRDASSDGKVTAAEAAVLQAVARKINSGAKR